MVMISFRNTRDISKAELTPIVDGLTVLCDDWIPQRTVVRLLDVHTSFLDLYRRLASTPSYVAACWFERAATCKVLAQALVRVPPSRS